MLTLTLTVNGSSDSTNFDADTDAHCEWTLSLFFGSTGTFVSIAVSAETISFRTMYCTTLKY